MFDTYLTYKNWVVSVDDDHSDFDVQKFSYTATHKITKRTRLIDVTPYGLVHPKLIKTLIDLDFPSRMHGRPYREEDLPMLESLLAATNQAAE